MVILQRMLIFLIMMALGALAKALGIITREGEKLLSSLIITIVNPAQILSGAVSNTSRLSGNELLTTVAISLGMYAMLILIATFLPGLLRFPKDKRNAARIMLVFSNVGFMGLPLVASIYGSAAMIYVVMFQIPFNVLYYTYGIMTMSAGKGKTQLKKLINPGVIACVITIILYFVDIKMPVFISESVSMLSGVTAPITMMVIGASLLDINWSGMFKNVSLLGFVAVKMLVLPVAFLFLLKNFVHSEVLLGVCVIMAAAPVATMAPMLSKQYDEGSYEMSSAGTSLTTVLSVLTIPIVSLITGIG